jgi:DegV family protein with EDD domain
MSLQALNFGWSRKRNRPKEHTLNYLDGKRLRRAVNAGWLWLNHHRNRLNAINVFPVADGDTGTNMSLTLRSAAMGAKSAKSDSLPDVADAIALYSLRGAQGNSGVILSQYFKGVAESIRGRTRLYVDDLAETFRTGSNSAYKAVRDPREGTILTVLSDIASHAENIKSRRPMGNFMESIIARGKQSLQATKHKLKALSDANVVDAGGQGFLHFMEGIVRLMKQGEVKIRGEMNDADLVVPTSIEEHSAFRFCSEFLVKGVNFDTEAIRQILSDRGDSLIVAAASLGNESFLRIHIHTDTPGEIETLAANLGTLEKRKIDDMRTQNRSMQRWRSVFKRNAPKTVKIVTDSTCDLPPALAAFFGIEVVPLKVSFENDIYLDGVDLDNFSFYRMLKERPVTPKTSQPSPGDFLQRYSEIFEREDCQRILSIHVSSKLSGTFNSSFTAAKEFGDKVTTFDSGTVSLGMALMTIAAAEMARDGDSLDTIIKKLSDIKMNQGLYFTLGTLDYLIRGGRIGRARGMVGKLLGLRPVLSLVDGEVVPAAKVRGDNVLEKILSLLPRNMEGFRWAIGHADCPNDVGPLTEILKERFGAEDVLTGEIGPTVGTHAGPGSWGVFYMKGLSWMNRK